MQIFLHFFHFYLENGNQSAIIMETGKQETYRIMRLLLSNDDGVFAPGILALAQTLCREHEIFISAPDRQQSAVSRGMTLYDPLRALPVRLAGISDIPAYAVSGTPVDCVRLGIGNLFDAPDMVVSGINLGPNLGTDVLYSGTVAAAAEAALLGYPAIAVSNCAYEPKHFETAAEVAVLAVRYLAKHPMPFGTVLNVNVPDVPREALRGVKLARTCINQYTLKYVKREDPTGHPYFWAPRGKLSDAAGQDVDERWTTEGYAVLTPLSYDLTDYQTMEQMKLEQFFDRTEE